MKRFAITVLAVFAFILSLRAQVHIQEMSNYEPVGRNLLNQREVIAFKETFDVTIQRADFDSVTNTVLLTLKDEVEKDEKIVDSGICHAVFFDLEHNELKWRKKYYRNEELYIKRGPRVFKVKENDFFLVEAETGEEQFKIGTGMWPVYFNTEEGWMICMTGTKGLGSRRNLCRIDLKSKSKIWERDVKSAQEFEMSTKLNDSTLLFVGNGLYSVDINNGEGWRLETNMQEISNENYGLYSLVSSVRVCSNPFVDGSDIYIAGIKRLIKTDRNGKELWHARLPEQKTSLSRLFATKEYLLMVNMGFAPHSYSFYYTYLGKWGKPFLAAYDKKTGKNVYMHERKKYVDFIKDVEFRDDDALFLLFADKEGHQSVEKYQANTGALMGRKEVAPVVIQSSGSMNAFVGSDVCVKKDNKFVHLVEMDTVGVYVVCDNGVLHLDGGLKSTDFISFNDLFVYNGKYGDLRFYSHGKETVVVDGEDREVATLDFPDVFCTESQIYSIKDKSLYVINKEQLY
ncbi:MAG: hypothetical protein Q4F82_00025 [bacterium]|nr:hypothetical protein [bacterium]